MNDFHPQYDYRAVQGDREPIDDTLAEPDGTTVDLTGRSVQVIVRHTRSGAKVADEPATIEDAGAGSVSYTLSADQTTRAGDHEIEWIVTGGSDDPSTYPVERPRTLGIREDVETDDGTTEPLPEDREVDTLYANALGTAARPVGEEHVESSHIEKLFVSDSTAVTAGPVGDEGELVHLYSCKTSANISTTSTTFERPMGAGERYLVPFDQFNLTNISNIRVSMGATLSNDTSGETTTIRLRGNAGTEVSATGTSFPEVHSDPTTSGAVVTETTPQQYEIEVKVTAGTGTVLKPTMFVWGEIA